MLMFRSLHKSVTYSLFRQAAQQCAAPDASSRVHGFVIVGLAWALSQVSYGVRSLGEMFPLAKAEDEPESVL